MPLHSVHSVVNVRKGHGNGAYLAIDKTAIASQYSAFKLDHWAFLTNYVQMYKTAAKRQMILDQFITHLSHYFCHNP